MRLSLQTQSEDKEVLGLLFYQTSTSYRLEEACDSISPNIVYLIQHIQEPIRGHTGQSTVCKPTPVSTSLDYYLIS